MNGINLNIDNNDNGNGNSNVGRTSQPAATPTSENRKVNTPSQGYSPFQYNDGFGGTAFGQAIHANEGSEAFNKIVESMTKIVAASGIKDRIDIIPFAREVHTNLSYSAIAVVRNNRVRLNEQAPQHKFVTVQVLIMEASGEVLRPYTDNSDSRRPVLVTPTTEDAFNSLFIKYLTENLKSTYGDDVNVVIIDPVIIPRDKDLTADQDIRILLNSAQQAVETRSHVRVPHFVDYNFVRGVGGDGIVLPVSADIVSEDLVDVTGRTFHTDAVVTVSVERQGNRNSGQPILNGAQESRTISRTHVAIDLIPVEASLLDENRVSGRGRRDEFVPDVAWAPRLTARLIDQYMTRTPSGIMFAISAMSELARDRLWAQSFRQTRGSKSEHNLRDIGYLNIEANLDQRNQERYGAPIDTRAADFGDLEMGIFLDKTVTRSPILAVSCMTSGTQAYTTTGLYLAARGSKDEAYRANAELMRSMNDATDGILFDLIDPNTPVVLGEGDLRHVGYWYDNNDKKRDIIELDSYLAMSIRGGVGNPQMAREWSDTYLNTRDSEKVRLAQRLQLLQASSSGAVIVTGTCVDVEINGEVVDAFVSAMEKAKLPLLPRSGEGDLFSTTRNVRKDAGRALYRGNGFGRTSSREGGRGSSRYAASRN